MEILKRKTRGITIGASGARHAALVYKWIQAILLGSTHVGKKPTPFRRGAAIH